MSRPDETRGRAGDERATVAPGPERRALTAAEGRDEGLASVSIKTLIFGRVVCVLCSFELFMEIFGVSYHVVL